jgi:hypothetical protein
MPFSQQYISDQVDETTDLQFLIKQISELGFDPVKEIPKVFSIYQITEGLDIYYELRQNLQLKDTVNNNAAIISFTFRSIREEEEDVFRLIDIGVKLYLLEDGKPQQKAEKYFGKNPLFPTKSQMINETIDKAISLSKAQFINKQIEDLPIKVKNLLTNDRQRLK